MKTRDILKINGKNPAYFFEWQLYDPIVFSVVFCWREGKKKKELYTYLN